MITTIYTSEMNTSSKKTIKWFTDNKIPFRVVTINKETVAKEELRKILALSDFGLDELIKRTVKIEAIEDLPLSEALDILIDYPKMIRSPIISNGKHLQIGFHDEEIRSFIPRQIRLLSQLS